MPAVPGGNRLDEIVCKWRDLADRRLAYYAELYRSGRWRHYYTRERFAMRMLDVIRSAKLWAALADKRRQAPQAAVDDQMRTAA